MLSVWLVVVAPSLRRVRLSKWQNKRQLESWKVRFHQEVELSARDATKESLTAAPG